MPSAMMCCYATMMCAVSAMMCPRGAMMLPYGKLWWGRHAVPFFLSSLFPHSCYNTGMERIYTLENELTPQLPAPMQVLCFDTLPSTNTFLKELSRQGEQRDTLCLALSQTAGRGRLGRSFDSQAGKGLYMSLLLHPHISPEQTLPATGLAAVATARGIRQACGLEVGIKWMNDLICHTKKLCGILAELDLTLHGSLRGLIVGVGVNMEQSRQDFPPELKDMATSLSLEGHPVALPLLAASLTKELLALSPLLEGGAYADYLAEYRRRCVTLGKQVQLVKNGTATPARALNIDDAFGLLVQHPDGSAQTVTMGEVSVRGMYGYVK